jgi:uncharacterized cupredoxin-like copper-binding protein
MRKAGATVTALVVAFALSLVFIGGTAAAPALKTTTVNVSMFEMGFKLNKKVVPRGKVIFKVVNDGKLGHDFVLGNGKRTPVLQAGQTATLTVTFKKRSKVSFMCMVEGHAAAGMLGTLTVK